MTTTGLYELIHERISEIEGHTDASVTVIGETVGDDRQKIVYFDNAASTMPKEEYRRKSRTEDQETAVEIDKKSIRKKYILYTFFSMMSLLSSALVPIINDCIYLLLFVIFSKYMSTVEQLHQSPSDHLNTGRKTQSTQSQDNKNRAFLSKGYGGPVNGNGYPKGRRKYITRAVRYRDIDRLKGTSFPHEVPSILVRRYERLQSSLT